MKYKFKPFSKNIIFYDTEFSHLNPYVGEILSIGLVKLTGEELYLELEYDGPVNDWVKVSIIPTLKDKKVSRKEAIKRVRKFVGKDMPYVVCYVNQFDIIYTHKLFDSENIREIPFYWLPIDFASILFGMGINPEAYFHKSKDNFFKEIGVDTKKFKHTHNALDDAKLLREVYLQMVDQ
jgi:DNA polymerase III epsilon subunit-like protein